MSKSHHEIFEELLAEAKADENIIGFFLRGSRGKGFEHEHSDYDIDMIVKDEVAEEYKEKYKNPGSSDIDLVILSISEFSKSADWESSQHWKRYDFWDVKALVDKTGEVQKYITEKGSIPSEKKAKFIERNLDGYINAVFRSLKSSSRSDKFGMILEASASIPFLLNALFALHDRLTPFPSYLSRELEKHSLDKLPFSSQELLERVTAIITTGNLEKQFELGKVIDYLFRKEGFGYIFDAWEEKLPWK